MAWSYTATQGLVAYEPPPEMQWQDGEDDTAYHARIGYQESYDGHIGGELLPGWYETAPSCDPQAPYRYLVYINAPGSAVEQVWIPTFPDWLAFLAQYGPAVSASALHARLADMTDLLADMTDLLEKAFQAWHGHHAMDLCRTCDPHGWERQMERRRAKTKQVVR